MQRMAHERHPWLIALPVAAVLFTLIADSIFIVTRADGWWLSARPVLTVGLAGLVMAIAAGIWDLRSEPAGEPRAVAAAYVGMDLTVLMSLGLQTWLRWVMPVPTDATPGIAWSVITGLLLVGSVWLGRTIVQIHHPPVGHA